MKIDANRPLEVAYLNWVFPVKVIKFDDFGVHVEMNNLLYHFNWYGECFLKSGRQLRNKKRIVFVNFYPDDTCAHFDTEEKAQVDAASRTTIAIAVPVEI